MRTPENKSGKKSEYYIYSPGRTARELFLYPICAGLSCYEAGYLLQRNRFDSFLILYVISGSLNVRAEGIDGTAREGQFLILDCYSRIVTEPEKTVRCFGYILTESPHAVMQNLLQSGAEIYVHCPTRHPQWNIFGQF